MLRAAGLHTAWSDKHPAYDLINGPSGTGVEDLYTPEINANGTTDSVAATEAYDDLKVKAVVLNEIDGKDQGVIYTKPGKKIAEHGGFAADDTNVALLLSYSGMKAVRMEEPVQTTQVAPTILQTLGLNPDVLPERTYEGSPGVDFHIQVAAGCS